MSYRTALQRLGGTSPFSPDGREPEIVSFPVAGKEGLTKRQAQIYDRGTEHAMEIELGKIKTVLGVQAVRQIEEYANLSFLHASNRLAERLESFARACPNPDIQALQVVFTIEGARRMGSAMAGIVDAGEGNIGDAVGRDLQPVDVPSLLQLLLGRRRY